MTSYSMDDIMMTSFYKLTCRSQLTVPESLLQQISYQIRKMRRRVLLFWLPFWDTLHLSHLVTLTLGRERERERERERYKTLYISYMCSPWKQVSRGNSSSTNHREREGEVNPVISGKINKQQRQNDDHEHPQSDSQRCLLPNPTHQQLPQRHPHDGRY